MVRAHLLISGVVQGVGYRWACRRAAQSIGVTGWVRNLPDGRVEAVVQGHREQVDRVIQWCQRGPEDAQVSDVAVSYEEAAEEFQGFGIR
ncbi:MAG TPA: acylphosphatase [Planctomycetota bacterium]|nr:acylphosphatase [Planctomycetota bacterium]